MRRIITISYTGLDAPGGVPRWNRDFHSAFPDRERLHFCWRDFPSWSEGDSMPEWVKAQVLNRYLLQKRLVTSEDVVVVDGFWGRGLEHLPFLISVCHGIWGHVTSHDETPENQFLHLSQIEFRQRMWDTGGRMVAVSDFIADTMRSMWGWQVPVINNAAKARPDDEDGTWPGWWEEYREKFRAKLRRHFCADVIAIVHGVNDPGNVLKGWTHVEHCRQKFREPNFVFKSLDEFHDWGPPGHENEKGLSLFCADIVLIPSSYEGNSYFASEALLLDLPVVSYDVGFFYEVVKKGRSSDVGVVIPRAERSERRTEEGLRDLVSRIKSGQRFSSRQVRQDLASVASFKQKWRAYVEAFG